MGELDKNVIDLLEKRYFKEGEHSWSDLAHRVAASIAMAEKENDRPHWEAEFYNAINNMVFIPSTPCLINANKEGTGQLSSCFIIDLKDNIDSIYRAKGECAKIYQRNGGVGFNISVLRPEGDPVIAAGGKSCGAMGFMEEFDLTADVITRNNARKGALKIDMCDWHPDILKFISCKDETDKLNHMNISVALSDDFMTAVARDEDWNLIFPDYQDDKAYYDEHWTGDISDWTNSGHPIRIYQTLKARDLYHSIMEHAWRTGEPGVSFITRMDEANPNPELGHIKSTNPCAEFCSVPYNSCNLGSINLLKCLSDNGQSFDPTKVEQAVKLGIRFLDDMITVNNLPLPKLRETTAAIRSVGLGTMGLADALYSMGVRYGSDESIQIIKRLYENIRDFAEMETQGLGRTKGNYPAYQENHWNGFPRRNSNLISLAPNGSIGTIAGVSCGIEPNFALAYTRSTSTGESYNIVNPILKKALIGHKIDIASTIEKIKKDGGSIQEVWAIPSDIKNIFVSASDLTPSEHLKVMAALQPFVDLSISKTINMPYEATVEDVENVYKKAWEYGLKGVTIYRNNSRPNQTLSVEVKEKADIGQPKKLEPESELKRGEIISVDDDLLSMKRTIKNGCGKFYLHVDFDEVTGEPMETYIDVSSGGGCERNLQLISRLMSLALRSGVPIESIIDQCQSVKPCKAFTDRTKQYGDTSKGTSCSSAIGWALKDLNDKIRDRCFDDLEDMQEEEPIKELNIQPETPPKKYDIVSEKVCKKCDTVAEKTCKKCDTRDNREICPECGINLLHEGGCVTCPNCGWSKCG